MSSTFYFEKWKKTINKLDELVQLDTEYQKTKAHDKEWCDAVQRLSSILGGYMFIYNEVTDCYLHNLQVQKAGYIACIIRRVTARILELKAQLRKLEGSNYHFMGHGLIKDKLTTYDVELTNISPKLDRSNNIQELVVEAFKKAKDAKENVLADEAAKSSKKLSVLSQNVNWWDNTQNVEGSKKHKGIDITKIYELEKAEELTAENLERRKNVALIQAHERLRQVTRVMKRESQKREKWEKELEGTLHPPARKEIRERSAKIIQKVCRAYFEIKRKRIKECKRDEILDITLCTKPYEEITRKDMQYSNRFSAIFKRNEAEWKQNCEQMKQNYLHKKHDEIENDTRDEIMNWFQKWFEEVTFFHDIPKENQGGSNLIVTDEVPTPAEWLEKYETYLAEKKANRNKTAHDLKREKEEAKREKLAQKKADHLKKKMEEALLNKMMKNPNFHPGYHYPESRTLEQIIKAIEDYQKEWFELDKWEVSGIKEKFVIDIDETNAYMEARMEVRKSVDAAMRETLKILKEALKNDYTRNHEKMPEPMNNKSKRRKKKKRVANIECNENEGKMLEALALEGYLKEYPQTKIQDFIGDCNFVGDDLRCMLYPAAPQNGDIRMEWWDRCREVNHGSHRILLVGARGNGHTLLVHAMASVNDAVLYEIDPELFADDVSPLQLQHLVDSITKSARCTQPSIIFLKHVQSLYCTKIPPTNKENINLLKRYLVVKLLKKIHKSDKITVVGCSEPWLANSKQMLKKFPQVVLLPETNYSTISLILRNWIMNEHVVPRDLDVQTLARALQGYSFGHIEKTLSNFLSTDRILKIAVNGLSITEIYEYFLDSSEEKIDHTKYLKWYTDKTHWGKLENKRIQEQKDFQLLLQKWLEKKKKGKNNNTLSDTMDTDKALE